MPKAQPTRRQEQLVHRRVPRPAPAGAKGWACTRGANPKALPRTVALLANAKRVMPPR